MAVKILRTYKESLPALRLIGKRYTNADRDASGGFGSQWGQWFSSGWFTALESLHPAEEIENGYLGFMGCSDTPDSFEYWIGMFFPLNTAVPEGYAYIDLPASDVGMCWIQGHDENGEIYGQEAHNLCMASLHEAGFADYRDDFKGAAPKWWYFFERYNCPRFTQKQTDGTVILDYGMYIR